MERRLESAMGDLAQGLADLAALYESAMRYVVPGKELAVDKMPLNFRFVAEATKPISPKPTTPHCPGPATEICGGS